MFNNDATYPVSFAVLNDGELVAEGPVAREDSMLAELCDNPSDSDMEEVAIDHAHSPEAQSPSPAAPPSHHGSIPDRHGSPMRGTSPARPDATRADSPCRNVHSPREPASRGTHLSSRSRSRHGPRVKKHTGPYPTTRPAQQEGSSSLMAQRAAEEDARLNLSLYKEVARNWARIEDRRQVAILRRRVEQERRSALTPEERAEEDQARELAARLSRKGGYEFGGRGRGGRRY
ncbi:hypothetical protein BD779DRAFT_1685603 [Infundibulicybe gibba]|nr:hypothetical protein BD779DRAFT_1685603 [Infundibulicybe gibba]